MTDAEKIARTRKGMAAELKRLSRLIGAHIATLESNAPMQMEPCDYEHLHRSFGIDLTANYGPFSITYDPKKETEEQFLKATYPEGRPSS